MDNLNTMGEIDPDDVLSLCGKCILPDNGLILGKRVYSFGSGAELRDTLSRLAREIERLH